MNVINTVILNCCTFLSCAQESEIIGNRAFSDSVIQEAYQIAAENHPSSPTANLKKDIEARSKMAVARLGIEVPWLSELIAKSVLSYVPISEGDAWIKRSFQFNQPVETLLSRGYDFCWFKFQKWDHTYKSDQNRVMRQSIAPDLGFLDEGIILSKGILYTIDRRARFELSDTDKVDFFELDDIIGDQTSYLLALDMLDRNCVDDARWSRVVTLLSDYPSMWFHPQSLKIKMIRLNHADYQNLLKLFSSLQVNRTQTYSVEQILLGEQIYTGSQLSGILPFWQYYLYGFHDKIVGISHRDNLDHHGTSDTLYALCEHFIELIEK